MSTTDHVVNAAGTEAAAEIDNNIQTSTAWVMITYLVQQGVRLASNLILTRILAPEAFALVALCTIVIIGCEMMSDVGIRASILRHKDAEQPHFYKTAWTLQTLRGLILGSVVMALAIPMSEFYEAPQLKYLLFLLALQPVLLGCESIGVFLAERRLRYFNVFRAFVMEPLVAAPVGIIIAWQTGSVWALAIMAIAGITARVTAGHIIFRETRMGFHLNREATSDLINFGKWIIIASGLAFIMYQMDRLTLGKLVDLKLLGIYSIALMWAEVPLLMARRWISSIFHPLVAKWKRTAENPGDMASRYRSQVLFVAAVPFGIGVGLGAPILEMLYVPPFTQAGTFLTILLFAAWIGLTEEMYGQMLIAWGHPKKRMWSCLMAIIGFSILVYPLFGLFGAHGVAVARVATVAVLLVVQWWFWRADGSSKLLNDFAATLMMAGAAAATWLFHEQISRIFTHSVATVICMIIGGGICFFIANRNRARLLQNPGS